MKKAYLTPEAFVMAVSTQSLLNDSLGEGIKKEQESDQSITDPNRSREDSFRFWDDDDDV